MDSRIYKPSNAEMGIYSTRRFPKGLSSNNPAPGVPSVTEEMPHASIPRLHLVVADEVAPALNVERWRYLVPKLRRARLQAAAVAWANKAGVAGGFNATIVIQRAGVIYSSINDFRSERIAYVNGLITTGTQIERAEMFGSIDLFEDDQVFAFTSRDAVGTSDWIISATVIEFDAVYTSYRGGILSNPADEKSAAASAAKPSVGIAPAGVSRNFGPAVDYLAMFPIK